MVRQILIYRDFVGCWRWEYIKPETETIMMSRQGYDSYPACHASAIEAADGPYEIVHEPGTAPPLTDTTRETIIDDGDSP